MKVIDASLGFKAAGGLEVTRDEESANRANATELLAAQWDAWCDAHEAAKSAGRCYEQLAQTLGIPLCQSCNKPMPEYDHSQECDGCHLPWGWNTPAGQRELRAAELDRKLAQLQKEREAL